MRNKKALSNVVAYVLLIVITISLSTIIFTWLKFYVGNEEIKECSKDVNVMIESYSCFFGKNLTVILKNKGMFTVDGYIVRAHDRINADYGIYILNETEPEGGMKPGERPTLIYNFPLPVENGHTLNDATLIEVQPFMKDDEGKISCKSYISQKIECH